mgnify:FL=1
MADDRYEAYRAMNRRNKVSIILEKVNSMQFLDILEESLKVAKQDENLGLYDIIFHVLANKGLHE